MKEILTEEIAISGFNPRKKFDAEKMTELVESIKKRGILLPIIVREKSGPVRQFELVSGERRLRAAKEAKLATVPAIIKELSDSEVLEIQIIENIQREDLTPLEEAQGLKILIEKYKYKQEELAQKIGKSQGYIAARLALLEIPKDFQELLNEGVLTPGHAKYLMILKGADKVQISLMGSLKNNFKSFGRQITVKDFEDQVKDTIHNATKKLYKETYGGGNPEFDLKDCEKCEFNKSVDLKWEKNKKRCFNPSCWNRKQAAKLSAKNESIKKQIEKGNLVKKSDIKGALFFDGYNPSCNFDKKTCKSCKNKKVIRTKQNRYGQNGKINREGCLDKECFLRKNKEAEEKKIKEQERILAGQVQKIKDKAARTKMDRNFWILILADKLHGWKGKDENVVIQAYKLDMVKLKTRKGAIEYFTKNKYLNLEEIFRFITFWED